MSTRRDITAIAWRLVDAYNWGNPDGRTVEELAEEGNREGFGYTLAGVGPGVEVRYEGVILSPEGLAAAVATAKGEYAAATEAAADDAGRSDEDEAAQEPDPAEDPGKRRD